MSEKQLIQLQDKIDKLKDEVLNKNKTHTDEYDNNRRFPSNIALELVSDVVAGLVMGIVCDNVFDSKPMFLILCIILATVVAFRSIWKKNVR